MNTYEMLQKSINAKIVRGALTDEYIESTKNKLDVFLMADRITEDQFNALSLMLQK